MTGLTLYKFISDNNVEWHRRDNNGTPDIVIFPLTFQIDDFVELVKGYTGDGGIDCTLMDGYFCFWMKEVCDYYGIDMNTVFIEAEQD